MHKEGDKSKGVCVTCEKLVDTTFEKHDIILSPDSDVIRDILVSVCDYCGGIVAISGSSSKDINDQI